MGVVQVSIVRHLHAFPHDPLSTALNNVLAFDALDPMAMAQLHAAFERQGIMLGDGGLVAPSVSLASDEPVQALQHDAHAGSDVNERVGTIHLTAPLICDVTTYRVGARDVTCLFDGRERPRPPRCGSRGPGRGPCR